VARSPIAFSGPLTIVDGWEVSAAPRSPGSLRLADASAQAKVGVRADAELFDVPFRSSRRSDGVLIVGSSPGEWLLVGKPGTAAQLADTASEAAGGEFATIVDLTHGRALVRLTGRDAVKAFAKVCAVDLSDKTTPDGSAFRTSVAKVATDIVRDDAGAGGSEPSYLLHCERSSGQYLFDALLDAGKEFGIEKAGSDMG